MADYTEEEVFAEIAKTDFLIDTHLSNAVLPHVLAAAAMGKKILSPSVDAYSEYLDSEFFIPIKYRLESEISLGPVYEFLWYTFKSERRHYGFKRVDMGSLKGEVGKLDMLDKKEWKVSEGKIKVFKNSFNCSNIVMKSVKNLEKFFLDY